MRAAAVLVFVLFSVPALSQLLVPAAQPANTTTAANTIVLSTCLGIQAHAGMLSSSFSKAHAVHPLPENSNPSRNILESTLWGGLSGAAFGATLVLSDVNVGYRPKSKDVLTFSVLGAGAGLAVGFVTGMIRAAKQKKRNRSN